MSFPDRWDGVGGSLLCPLLLSPVTAVPSEPWVLLRDLTCTSIWPLGTYCPIPSVLRFMTASPASGITDYCHDMLATLPSSYCVPDIRLKNH